MDYTLHVYTHTHQVRSDLEEGAVDVVPLHRHLQQQHSPLIVWETVKCGPSIGHLCCEQCS